MRILDRAVAWSLLAIGIIHCLYTFGLFNQLSSAAMWFFSGGLMVIYLAAFNLLRERYASVAPGVRRVCLAANLAALGFAMVYAGRRGTAVLRDTTAVILLVLLTTATIFSSVRPRPRIHDLH